MFQKRIVRGVLAITLGGWALAAALAAAAPDPASAPAPAAPAAAPAPKEAEEAALDAAQAPKKGALAEAWEWFRIKWEVGGPTMWALGLAALVAVVFAVDRLVGLRRGRIVPRGLADQANRFWLEGRYDQVLALANRSRSTLGEIIAFLVEHRNNSYEHLTSAAEDIAARDFERHARGNYPMVAVGTLAPLLGLLGTVLGLFGAFSTIGVVGSMDDPSALAGDIGEAIITTVAGLMIAIPSVSLYHYFYHRTSQFAVILGAEVSNLMHGWFLKKEAADARQG